MTAGVEPASLNRIQSVDARDFIRQCLGTPDGQDGYLRPSATELLNHPFLAKNDDDGSEVLVNLPVGEVEIPEGTVMSALNDSTVSQPFTRRQSLQDIQTESERSAHSTAGGDLVEIENKNKIHQINDAQVGLSDEFVGLPDRESNIKNVKVLIGRGQHIDEEETSDNAGLPASISSQSLPQTSIEPISMQTKPAIPILQQPVQSNRESECC